MTLIKKVVVSLLSLTLTISTNLALSSSDMPPQLDVYHIEDESDYMDFYLDGKGFNVLTGHNNELKDYSIINGTTFIKLRSLSEALGVILYWNSNTQEVSFDANDKSVRLVIGNSVASIGDDEVALNAPPYIRDGFTYIPLRFTSEALGVKVNYKDIRAEGEYVKKAIFKKYPSLERLIQTKKEESSAYYTAPRLVINRYDPKANVMGILVEEKYGSVSNLINWFDINIEKRTIFDAKASKVVIDWYDKNDN